MTKFAEEDSTLTISEKLTRESLDTNSNTVMNKNSWNSSEPDDFLDAHRRESLYSEDDQDGESQRLSVDSGFEDIHRDDGEKESETLHSDFELIMDFSDQRKLQSILKTKPQVFIIRSDKVLKKKSKSHAADQSNPRKNVEFLFPEGVEIPERRPTKKKNRIHFPIHRAATRTLGHLKFKLTGRNPSVPILSSIHSSHTVRQNQKQKKTKLTSPPSARRTTKLTKSAKFTKKGVANGATSTEEPEVMAVKPLVPATVFDQDDDLTCTSSESDSEDHQDQNEIKADDGYTDTDHEEDESQTVSRRKALGYHIRRMHMQQQHNHPTKKVKKGKPTYLTVAGHSHHRQPKVKPQPKTTAVENADHHGGSKSNNKKKSQTKLSSTCANENEMNQKDCNLSSLNDDGNFSNENPKDVPIKSSQLSNVDEIKHDTGPGQCQQQQHSSRLLLDINQKIIEIRNRLLNESKNGSSRQTESPKPGRIISTRYRWDSTFESFPRFDC